MISFDISIAKSYNFGNKSVSEVYYGSTRIWPHDYSRDYLTIEALESGSIKWTDYGMYRYILYSLDNGNTWQQLNHGEVISSLDAGDKIMFKSDTKNYGFGNDGTFARNSLHFNVYGNAMSLIYGDDFVGKTDFNYFGLSQLGSLFAHSNVVDASNLILPALTMRKVNSAADNNYNGMFYNCYSLIAAPELPATTLADYCYSSMFMNCISLTTAPELPATTLADDCYNGMFDGCTSLNYIKCLATDISATSCTSNWVDGVSQTGTFVKSPNMSNWTIGTSGIPSGWTVQNDGSHDYSQDYLTFKALESGTFTWTDTTNSNSIYYSLDDGSTWTQLVSGSSTASVNTNDKVLFKASGLTVGSTGIGTFGSTGAFNAMGNIMSLVYGDNFVNQTTINSDYQFYQLFKNSRIVDASNLILPATTLSRGCYREMFDGSELKITPKSLPATTLATECYRSMFGNCASLTTVMSILPAMTLTEDCYRYMFGVSSLTIAPELPATTLALNCYNSMFKDCTNLTAAPELPATTLAKSCYSYMFQRCASLTTAPNLPATTLTDSCYSNMFQGCTSLTTPPTMSATTVATNCCASMFRDDAALTTAPDLLATTLARQCYTYMFRNCTSLQYIKCLATNISAQQCTQAMTSNVAANGTFVKSQNMSSWTRGTSGIPNGWRVQNDGSHDYSQDYLTFKALESGTFTWTDSTNNNSIYYSLDDGSTWTQLASGSSTPSVNTNDKVLFKASGLIVRVDIGKFSSSGRFNAMGNIMSLQDGDNFSNSTSISNNNQFRNLFNGCTNLVDASNLILPATTLADSCYNNMFTGCTSLTTAPVLSATTLATGCYSRMFNRCTSLTTAPMLPATTLVKTCYMAMFQGCTNLNYIKCLATDISALLCTDSWTDGVSQSGTFVKSKNMSSWTRGTSGIPNGWTVQNAS